MSGNNGGEDSTSKSEVCKLASDFANNPEFAETLRVVCNLASETAGAQASEDGKPQSQRRKLRLPDLELPDLELELPVKIKEPTVKWDDGAYVDAGKTVKDKKGNILYDAEEGELIPGKHLAVEDPDTKETKYYIVKEGSDNKMSVIRDSKVRPLTLAGRTVLVAQIANTLLDLAELDWENPDALLNYAEETVGQLEQLATEIVDAVEVGDVDFLSEVVIDAINPVTAIDTVFNRLDAYDIDYVDPAIHAATEVLDAVDDATKDFTKIGIDNVKERYAANPMAAVTPTTALVTGAETVADYAAPYVQQAVQGISDATKNVAQEVGNFISKLKIW